MAEMRAPAFRGRARERRQIDRLLDGVRRGESSALVIRGEAGIGKTALLHYCGRQAAGCRVGWLAGVESELELPFAALHQLCEPLLAGLPALPPHQQQALQVSFGLASGGVPDRFLVGLAVLGLLAEAASQRPLVCLIDDAQWLDNATVQVLGFVARRLLAESVMVLFAVREAADDRLFPALPALTLEGLTDDDARALLTAAVPGHLDVKVRDRLVAETRGHPLALLELARGISDAELAAGFAVPATTPLSAHLYKHYIGRVRALPEQAHQLVLLAAADPTGDAALLWRASRRLGPTIRQEVAGELRNLVEIGAWVRFRHPLVREAAYAAALPQQRRAAHRALAEATDTRADPERRMWHEAAAVSEPDEAVAAALEQAAIRTQARAGLAAAVAVLERSVALTPEPGTRADRALAAAIANLHAGAFDTARGLLAQAESDAVHDLQRARVEQLRGQIEWASVAGREAPVLLRHAAARLEALDVGLARETYLHAYLAATVAGPLAGPGGLLLDVSHAARVAPQPEGPPRACDLVLDGLVTMVLDGRAAAEPILRRAVNAFLDDRLPDEEWLQWGILAQQVAMALWDFDSWVTLSARYVDFTRASGALTQLSIALNARGTVATQCGDFETTTSLAAEKDVINDVTGIRMATACDLLLAGYRGRYNEASSLVTATIDESVARGEGFGVQMAQWAMAVLGNGLGRYTEAFSVAEQAADEAYQPLSTQLVLPELIEAAARTRRAELARASLQRLSAMTVEGSDWAKGLEARCRALVSGESDAQRYYVEAVERLERTPLRPELARARLLYGEWLRRTGKRVEARHQLRGAYELFSVMGAEAFAERARHELASTGDRVPKREVETHSELTPQEQHIARLARDGNTNSEIAAKLFLSTRTIEWHLRKIFTKLGIGSRRDLDRALAGLGRAAARA